MTDDEIRLLLHNRLLNAFPGLKIYYQPPGNHILERPCIVYKPQATEPSYANNSVYSAGTRFQVTILSDRPGYSDKRNMFTIIGVNIVNNTSYMVENIVHDVFTISVNSI